MLDDIVLDVMLMSYSIKHCIILYSEMHNNVAIITS